MNREFTNREAATLAGERVSFSFGRNWQKYVTGLSDDRIARAMAGLRRSLGDIDLASRRFIDVGCGSGLASLCAARLGAVQIVSLDVDPNSVACTAALRMSVGAPENWQVLEASILDGACVDAIAPADVVYSWGVLHHTGRMWDACRNTVRLAHPGGFVSIALYNRPRNPGRALAVKRAYNRTPRMLQPLAVRTYGAGWLAAYWARQRVSPARYVRSYGTERGMDYWRDVEDWLGGLPYEFATPKQMAKFAADCDCTLLNVREAPAGGVNEYLLKRH